jgi:integrase
MADRGAKAATIARRLVVISQAHKGADLPSPTTSSLVTSRPRGRPSHGRHRSGRQGARPRRRPEKDAEQASRYPGRPARSRTAPGWLCRAFRRSELVSLDVADLEFSSAGLVVTLRVSKTDQEAKGRRLGIPFGSSEATCPVRAVQAWLETARIVDGPVFRPLDRFQRVQPTRLSAERVALIVKRRAKAVGLDPARYAGHSLRAGLATSAAAAGASDTVIMSQTGHRSADMVRQYIREGSLFRENAASLAGL